MKNKSAKIALFIGTLIVGILIAINFNFDGITSRQLTAKEYQDAIEERTQLYKQISLLEKSNKEFKEKIEKYNNDDKVNGKVLEDMRNQLGDYGMLTGLNEVKGPGLIITINDAIINFDEDTEYEVMNKILHDSDMALLINELRGSGAEAISVNNHRVTPNTAVVCNSAFIGFDDGDREAAPFKIYVIGNAELMEESLNSEGSHLRILKQFRGLDVTIEKSDEIIMPAASNHDVEYAEEDINK